MANCYRPARDLHEGDSAPASDPKLGKNQAGRAPWKRPLTSFGRVTKVVGNKVDVQTAGGVILREVNRDRVVVIPNQTFDHEARELALEPDPPDATGAVRSPGQVLEVKSAGRQAGVPWRWRVRRLRRRGCAEAAQW